MEQHQRAELREQLVRHEGRVPHAYQDHLGFWTVGVGRLIDQRRGGGLSDAEIDYLLDNDIQRLLATLPSRISFWHRLTVRQQQALLNMAFQMGVNGVMGFRNMLAALGRGDGYAARDHALDSAWARQTPKRAVEVAGMLLS